MNIKKTLNPKRGFLDAQSVRKTHFDMKRGILIGLALYIATIILRLIITFTFMTAGSKSPLIFQTTTYLIISFISLVVLVSFASLWYFKKAKRNAKEGLKLGVTFIIINFLLDLLYIKVFSTSPLMQIVTTYLSDPSFYTTLILIIALVIFIGSRSKSHNKEETHSAKRIRKHGKKR